MLDATLPGSLTYLRGEAKLTDKQIEHVEGAARRIQIDINARKEWSRNEGAGRYAIGRLQSADSFEESN